MKYSDHNISGMYMFAPTSSVLVIRKVTVVCISHHALVTMNDSCTTVWWKATALPSSNSLASFSSLMSKSLSPTGVAALLVPEICLLHFLDVLSLTPVTVASHLLGAPGPHPDCHVFSPCTLSTLVCKCLPNSMVFLSAQNPPCMTPSYCTSAIQGSVVLHPPRLCWPHMDQRGSPQIRNPPALIVTFVEEQARHHQSI